jgi:hypothetical protein
MGGVIFTKKTPNYCNGEHPEHLENPEIAGKTWVFPENYHPWVIVILDNTQMYRG